jgi:hypothetical protein
MPDTTMEHTERPQAPKGVCLILGSSEGLAQHILPVENFGK